MSFSDSHSYIILIIIFKIEAGMKRNIVKQSTKTKILEDQAQKLKQKLETLKKQISAKKMQKQASRNTPISSEKVRQEMERSANSRATENQPIVSCFTDVFEPISSKLNAKGITTLEQLSNLKEEEIDNWKDIGIGYRIKIKNYLRQEEKLSNSRYSSAKKSSRLNSPEKLQNSTRDIQDIIKNRKQVKVFVPIKDREQEEQQEVHIGPEEQQVMIKSLMNFFKVEVQGSEQRDSAINGKGEDYECESQDTIEEIQYVQPADSIKVIQFQQLNYLEDSKIPNYKYCWLCLRKIDEPEYVQDNRQFCSLKCRQKYEQESQIPQSSPFYSQIAEVQDAFNSYLKKRQEEKKKKEEPKKLIIRRQPKREYEKQKRKINHIMDYRLLNYEKQQEIDFQIE